MKIDLRDVYDGEIDAYRDNLEELWFKAVLEELDRLTEPVVE